MPRVNRDNRDLQRRLAARRGRERRRPDSEQRYRFAPSVDAPVEAPTEGEEEVFDGAPEMLPQRESAPPKGTPRTQAPRQTPRASARPFSAYAAEYAYVGNDLRRIVLVVGTLLVLLIILHFVLPR